MLYVGHCEPDLYSGYIRVAAIVLLLWLLSRSAQAVLERRVPSVYTSLHYRLLLALGPLGVLDSRDNGFGGGRRTRGRINQPGLLGCCGQVGGVVGDVHHSSP